MEIPFQSYSNMSEVNSIRDFVVQTTKEEKIENINQFQEQAQGFISAYKSKVGEINEIEEQKKILLKTFIDEIESGVKPQEIKINEKNPFA
jgi:hypothetical protein